MTAKITRRQTEIIKQLMFRAAGEHGSTRQVCWLGKGSGDRWLLIVPTMMGGWDQLEWINGATLAPLEAAGIIEFGPDEDLPKHVNGIAGMTFGHSVRLIRSDVGPIGVKTIVATLSRQPRRQTGEVGNG